MSTTDQPHTITDLLSGLIGDISGLFRKEIQLAKAEAGEKLEQTLDASKGFAIGAVLAIGAVGVLLAAVVTGVAAILTTLGMAPGTANFIASLAVGIITGGIAWMFISQSISAWKATHLNLNRTTRSLARDAEVVKESF